MKTLHGQLVIQPAIDLGRLFKLERCGRYADAFEQVKDVWKDLSFFPDVKNFESRIAAEILLRCGSLAGFLGPDELFEDSQKTSKDILTEAHTRFHNLGNIEKVAECENYLALAYWRTGELNEASIWLESSLSHNLPDSNLIRLYSVVINALILLSFENYHEIKLILSVQESNFLRFGDHRAKGDFYNNFGIAHNELGNCGEALRCFELAQFFYQKAQHKVYLGTVGNNLAQLHKLEKRYARAHKATDDAAYVFKKIKDKTREGFSFDTKAQIFLAERKYAEGLQAAEKGIAILKEGGNVGYLVEALMTKTKLLLYLNNFQAAVLSLFDAVKIKQQQSGEASAEKLVQEFEAVLRDQKILPVNTETISQEIGTPEPSSLALILPDALAHFTDIQGVWITNSHLEKIGIYQGAMVIVAKQPIERGELAAVVEKETDEVICGIYDSEFGIVCLTGIDSEPQLFSEESVEILGKIIGVCDSETSSDGTVAVMPINF